MNKVLSASLKIIGALVLACVIAVGSFFHTFNQPVKMFEITNGNAGAFLIGETKESILARLPNEAFSPKPKPTECPANWIEVKTMSPTQKQCLLNTNEWDIGGGIRELCPEKTDFFATIFFAGNKASKIRIRCTRPE
jgi:hypothetical protein